MLMYMLCMYLLELLTSFFLPPSLTPFPRFSPSFLSFVLVSVFIMYLFFLPSIHHHYRLFLSFSPFSPSLSLISFFYPVFTVYYLLFLSTYVQEEEHVCVCPSLLLALSHSSPLLFSTLLCLLQIRLCSLPLS